MGTSTPAEKAAVKKYQQSRDNIMIRPSKETGQKIRKAAAEAGLSVQQFILDAVADKIGNDNKVPGR